MIQLIVLLLTLYTADDDARGQHEPAPRGGGGGGGGPGPGARRGDQGQAADRGHARHCRPLLLRLSSALQGI